MSDFSSSIGESGDSCNTFCISFIYISAVKVNALTQINFNSTNCFKRAINAARIFCLTRGSTHSWRNGDAQCCQLSNSADPFSDFFPFKKPSKPNLVSENLRYGRARSCSPSARTHLSLSLPLCVCSVSVQRVAERSNALIQLNTVCYTDIMLLL